LLFLHSLKALLCLGISWVYHPEPGRARPIKVTTPQGQDFVVISVEDWEREQETLYILQNSSLIKQISDSMITHIQHQGYRPSSEEIDAILSPGKITRPVNGKVEKTSK
jgi:antitoxin YefM